MHSLFIQQSDTAGKNFWTMAKFIARLNTACWIVSFSYALTQPAPAGKKQQLQPCTSGTAEAQCVWSRGEAREVGLPHCGHNILHSPQKEQSDALSIIEMQQGQREVSASKVLHGEDSSLGDAILSANEIAYRDDMQRIIR